MRRDSDVREVLPDQEKVKGWGGEAPVRRELKNNFLAAVKDRRGDGSRSVSQLFSPRTESRASDVAAGGDEARLRTSRSDALTGSRAQHVSYPGTEDSPLFITRT